nr:glucose dehydrogenase [FAD, quinone]-like [Maniola hyperantus]
MRTARDYPCPIPEIGPSITSSCASQFFLFMSILESYVNSRGDLAGYRVKDRGVPDDSYDFVVIGGGTAGSLIAKRLSENEQWKVLLIEAGGDEPTPAVVPAWLKAYRGRNETDWNYSTVPQEKACLDSGGVCSWSKGKMLGGSSAINDMMYMRGNPADYDGWAANGATGWSWSEVFPYFMSTEVNLEIDSNGISEEYHSFEGGMPVQRFNYAPRFAHDVVSASIEMGYPPTSDLNGKTGTGFTIAQAYTEDGARCSTAKWYLRSYVYPAFKKKNLHILLNAEGSRVIVDSSTKKVTGVEYIKNCQKKIVGVNKEVVLSGGTINSPKILLLSGIGPKETLEQFNIPVIKDLPGVGQNLHDHVGVTLEFTLTKEPDVPELSWASAMEYLLGGQGPLSGTGLSQLTGKVNSRLATAGGSHPDVQFYFDGYSAACGDGSVRDAETLADESNKRTVNISAIALQPRSRGYLTLESTDPQQPPKLQPNYFLDEHELDVVVDAARIAYRIANTTILREKYGMQPTEGYGSECPGGGPNPTDEFFKCLAKWHTTPGNNQVGTCKMGAADDPMAVVDPQLKVYGIDGLRVADASIIPTAVSGNTAAPVVMIGERAAEFLIANYKQQGDQFEDNTPPSSDVQ